MAFGGLKGTLSVAANSITNPTNATGSVAVVVGDLVYVVVGEQTSPTSTAVTDNLGNTYAAVANATDAGTSTGRAFWSRVTNAGTLTTISVAATASSQNVAVVAVVIEGPFATSPLDANPTQITSDITSPYTCPSTGTLAQADEVVMAWIVRTGNTAVAATSPNLLALHTTTQTILGVAVGRQVVAATTAVAPAFTSSSNPTDAVLGTTSFKKAAADAPTVTTGAVTHIERGSATGHGNVTSDGNSTITERGVVWNTTGTPTTADSKATAAGTTGAYTAALTGLDESEHYYVRAYAINSAGTSYGSEVEFDSRGTADNLVNAKIGAVGEFAVGQGQTVLVAGGGEQTVAVNLSSETDTAQAAGRLKARAVGLAGETDTALAATVRRTQAVGLTSETDTAQAVTHSLARAIGLTFESDSALAAASAKTQAVVLTSETDSAQAATARRTIAIGLASETDAAQSAAHSFARSIGLASETDDARAVTSFAGATVIDQALETDTALAAGSLKAATVGITSETDSAFSPATNKTRATGLTQESASAQPMTWARALAVGLTSEIDLSQAVASRRSYAAGLAAETDAALEVGLDRVHTIGLAEESDIAFARPLFEFECGLAIESDIALPATVQQQSIARIPVIVGREPVTIVEIDQDLCGLTYGAAPCTAQLGVTGEAKCFNTFFSCQDPDNFTEAESPLTLRFCKPMESTGLPKTTTIIPSVISVDSVSTEINIGGNDKNLGPLGRRARITAKFRDHPYHDGLVDPYVSERDYDPMQRGAFWSKWLARNPYHQGRPLRVREGYVGQSLAEMRVRNYIIERINGPTHGEVEVIAKDPLKLLDNSRAVAPAATTGVLADDIAADETIAPLLLSGTGAQYPASGIALIGSELVGFTRSGDTLTLTGRGLRGTDASEHAQGDVIQNVLVISGTPIAQVIYDLLVDFAGIDPSFIPFAAWQAEANLWLAGFNLVAWITQPTGIATLVAEILEQGTCAIWWDDEDQKIKFLAVRPFFPAFDDEPTPVTQTAHIVADSFSLERRPDERISRVLIHYDQINPTGNIDDPANYNRQFQLSDTAAETAREYGEMRIKQIFARWMGVGNDASVNTVASRLLDRYRDPPTVAKFRTDAKDSHIRPGHVIRLEHRDLVDLSGAVDPSLLQLTAARPVVPGHDVEFRAMSYRFSANYAFIMENDAPAYGDASPEEKDTGGFIAPDAVGFDNGDPPYRIV